MYNGLLGRKSRISNGITPVYRSLEESGNSRNLISNDVFVRMETHSVITWSFGSGVQEPLCYGMLGYHTVTLLFKAQVHIYTDFRATPPFIMGSEGKSLNDWWRVALISNLWVLNIQV